MKLGNGVRIVHWLLAALLSLVALSAAAQRAPVPIVNHESIAVERPAGAPASAGDVKKAIAAAAVATGRKWDLVDTGPGRLLATYHVRTHTVVAEIGYSATSFSVAYRDSVNMKYTPKADGPGLIHPFYNQWVEEFIRAIRAELAKTP